MPRYLAAPTALCLALSLAACGMKGSLEPPPGPAPEPLLGHLKPKPKAPPSARTDAAPPAASDVSTDPEKTAR